MGKPGTGFRTPCSDANNATAGLAGGADAFVGAWGVDRVLTAGGLVKMPLLLRAARSSEVFEVGAAATLLCTLLSCVWLAFCNAGTAVRICGVLGFCPFASRACKLLSAPGARRGKAGTAWAVGACTNGALVCGGWKGGGLEAGGCHCGAETGG